MSKFIFFKRIFSNKVYWMSVLVAIALLMCSIIYQDTGTGETYTFVSLFYNKDIYKLLQEGNISLKNIIIGYDTGYLWMFCPIIVGIPCVLLNKTERFVLFRTSKNRYCISKYLSNILSGGSIILISYTIYIILAMIISKENMFDMSILRKLLSVFCWGIVCAIPSNFLSEFFRNKYLILCIPFVLNYFMSMFLGNIIPYSIKKYIDPFTYQILFLFDVKMIAICLTILILLIFSCAFFKKTVMERRCDCGQ